MAQNQQGLQLFYATGSLCDVMVRGNILLSTGNSAEAIHCYTKVLYKLSPGHVCAFLNRSMAWLEQGYYELAVMDAHRAKIAVDEMRNTSQVTKRRGNHIARYIKAECLHVEAHHGWTQAAQRNIGTGWARSPLASIVINAIPEAKILPFGTSKDSLIRALEIRATYRLCGALFMIGDGARKDALDLIENIRLTMQNDSWESRAFNKLGNDILDQVVSEVDPNDPMAIRLLGDDTKEERDERMKKLTENMKATTTRYGYGDYSWNSYEPNFGVIDWQMRVQDWVGSCNDHCSAAIIHPEGTEATQAEGTKSHVELRANQDIKSGDLVLSERTFASVTTSDPEKTKKNRLEGILDHFYCTTCATLLAVPFRLVKQHEEAQMAAKSAIPPIAPTSSSPTFPSQSSNNTTQGKPVTGTSATGKPGQSSTRHIAPSSLARPHSRQAFDICSPHRIVPTCSGTCRMLNGDFDGDVCGTSIARNICEDNLHYLQPRSMTDRKTLCLRDLIFLRTIIMALKNAENPLNTNTIVYATSGPNVRNTPITNLEPWSYTSHVVRPISYLQKLFPNTDVTDQFRHLGQLDGWIIHALLAKISKAMRISDSPRYAKVYSTDSNLNAAFGARDPRWGLVTQIPRDKIKEDKNDEPIWSAGIHPMLDMIRIADHAKGEIPNVEVVKQGGVYAVAVKAPGTTEPAIKAGEPLLRAGDVGVGRSGLEEGVGRSVSGKGDVEEPWYVAWLEEMMPDREDENGDGADEGGEEEVRSGDTSEFMDELGAEDGDDVDVDVDVDGGAGQV